jgi:hypothetical protein
MPRLVGIDGVYWHGLRDGRATGVRDHTDVFAKLQNNRGGLLVGVSSHGPTPRVSPNLLQSYFPILRVSVLNTVCSDTLDTMAKDLVVDPLHETILHLERRVQKLLSRQACEPRQRILVGLAGVPGSGKSTVSGALIAELKLRGVQDVVVVPMVCWNYMSLL